MKKRPTMETFELFMPWIIYIYGRTHDKWWPIWSSTRLLGYGKIGMECCVCGATEVAKVRIPRFGDVPHVDMHPERRKFCEEHIHPDRGHPMSWAKPLRNMVFFEEGIPLDLLAMRMEADLNEQYDAD